MNAYDQVREMVVEVRRLSSALNENASLMAEIIASDGNLRRVRSYTLKKLKKQLNDYNMHTGRWKDG